MSIIRTLFALALLTSVLPLAGSLHAELKVGDAMPLWGSYDLNSTTIPPTEGKVVLLDFWASWCVPCKASFAAYSRLQGEFRDAGLVVIAVGVDDSPAAYNAFVQRLKPSFAVVHDRIQSLVKAVKVQSMPTAYVIGRDGRVRSIHVGYFGQKSENQLRDEISAFLKEKPPAS